MHLNRVRKDGEVFLVDGRPLDRSNWMRYVNCAASPREQNLVAYTHRGNIYYRTPKAVAAGEELLVWYGTSFAQELKLLGKPRGSWSRAEDNGNRLPVSSSIFSCDTCGDMFSAQDLLEKHRRHKHPQRPQGKHHCIYCPYSSNFKTLVTRHERTHTGERPFVCHVCGKGFAVRHHLTIHLLVHSGEKPHECANCGQLFRHASSLATHHREQHSVDDGVLSHVCPHCGKGFSRRSTLKTHMLTHTATKPHACSQCGRRFTHRSDAQKHERVVHGRQYPLHCPHCGKGLMSISNLRKHVHVQHGSAEEDEPQSSRK